MKELILVSTNKHKFRELKKIALEFGIKLKMRKAQLLEAKADSIEKIALYKAKQAFQRFKKPLIVEDTGIYFSEYNNFPGAYSKTVYLSLGFKGLLRLIRPLKNKKAFFKTTICYIDGKKTKVFTGILKGKLTNKVYDKEEDVMPYEKIFKPKNYNITLSSIPRKEKNTFSHRAKAARLFFAWYCSTLKSNDHNRKTIKVKAL